MVWETLLWSVVIFLSRVVDVGLGTIRVQMIVQRKRWLAACIGFIEIIVYIVIVSQVIQGMGDLGDITSWIKVLAYAAGFAIGTLLGITLSERQSRGVVEATIITHEPCVTVETALREAGFALTRYQGTGREGPVDVISSVCSRKELPRMLQVVTQVDPQAFIYTQELAGLRGGYVYGVKSKL